MTVYVSLNFDMNNLFSNEDYDLIQKLKLQNPEHFQQLVKMHLSFALEINLNELDECDEKKFRISRWTFPFPRKDKTLKETTKFNDLEISTITDSIATQIHQIIQFLGQEKNISEEGIFRISGAISRQKLLINNLKSGTLVDLNDKQFTVHDCATVLKTYLSNLSEPLITDAYYPVYCHIAELCKHSEKMATTKIFDSLRLMILLLPCENAVILRQVILLLHSAANCAEKNKMSAENLATLFTPHLLCLRKFSGEALHTNTQLLWGIAVFMIQSGPQLFEVPSRLMTDVKLYWFEKHRRHLSPIDNTMQQLDESTTDSGPVHTVLSFVDREKTAQENATNTTETALAQLYAYIQSLPESNKKRRLIKQFNKENGQGTPRKLLINEDRSRLKKRNLDCFRHILFSKGTNKQVTKTTHCELDETDENAAEPKVKVVRKLKHIEKTLNYRDCGSSSDTSSEGYHPKLSGSNDRSIDDMLLLTTKNDEPIEKADTVLKMLLEKSAETITVAAGNCYSIDEQDELDTGDVIDTTSDESNKLTSNLERCQRLLPSSSIIRRRNSGRPQYRQRHLRQQQIVCSCPNLTSSSLLTAGTVTSTPAPYSAGNMLAATPPFSVINEDVSPITMSAKKMPKAMQEIMMTPRSRNPVVANSGSSTSQAVFDENCDLTKSSSHDASYSSLVASEDFKSCNGNESSKFMPSDLSSDQEVLSKTFQDYLLSRSMQNDPSFSSQIGDFSDTEKLSSSLLYCLDGNVPNVSRTSNSNECINETAL